VLATPLGPAGRIRGDVIDDPRARCARRACSLASRGRTHGLPRCVLRAFDGRAGVVTRLHASRRASLCDSAHRSREVPGRSEGRGPTRDAGGSRRYATELITVVASAHDRGARGSCGEDGCCGRRVCPRSRCAWIVWRRRLLRSSRLPTIEVRVVVWEDGPGGRRVCADHEVRVFATPLGPAGRIRGDVIDDPRGRCARRPCALASRSRAHGLLRCAIRACSAVRVCVTPTRVFTACSAVRARVTPLSCRDAAPASRASCARVSPHGPRAAPGRSEGRGPTRRACGSRRHATELVTAVASAHDRGGRRACGEDGRSDRRVRL
jgi:hypothetical protein